MRETALQQLDNALKDKRIDINEIILFGYFKMIETQNIIHAFEQGLAAGKSNKEDASGINYYKKLYNSNNEKETKPF